MAFQRRDLKQRLITLIVLLSLSGVTQAQFSLRFIPLNIIRQLVLIQMNPTGLGRLVCQVGVQSPARGGSQIVSSSCFTSNNPLTVQQIQQLNGDANAFIQNGTRVRQTSITSSVLGSSILITDHRKSIGNQPRGFASVISLLQNPQAQGWNSHLELETSGTLKARPEGIVDTGRRRIAPYRGLDLLGQPLSGEFEFGKVQASSNTNSLVPLQAYYQPVGQQQDVPPCDTVNPDTHLPHCISDGTLPAGHIVANFDRKGTFASLLMPRRDGTYDIFYSFWYLLSLIRGGNGNSCASEANNGTASCKEYDPDKDGADGGLGKGFVLPSTMSGSHSGVY